MLLRDYESLLAIESSACDNGSAGPYNITVEDCTLGWCGGNAIGSDYGYCTNFNIINNEIGFCGNYGLDAQNAGPVLVSNNYIHDCGLITWQAPGVRVNTNAVVTQNNLFNFHTSAIADHDVDNCVFSLNSISNCMFTEEDMGAYYQYFGSGSVVHPHGNIIVSNLFQSVGTNYNNESANPNWFDPRNFYRPAVYLDEQSSNTIVSYNVLFNCPTPVFQHNAANNFVLNNVAENINQVSNYDTMRLYNAGSGNLTAWGNIFYSADNVIIENPSAYLSLGTNFAWSVNPADLTGLPPGIITVNPQLVPRLR